MNVILIKSIKNTYSASVLNKMNLEMKVNYFLFEKVLLFVLYIMYNCACAFSNLIFKKKKKKSKKLSLKCLKSGYSRRKREILYRRLQSQIQSLFVI